MDRQGHLQKDIVLGEGDMYHPGGIDFDGTNVWVPVAAVPARQQRDHLPGRRHDACRSTEQFERRRTTSAASCSTRPTGHLVGNTWGSRRSTSGRRTGGRSDAWTNPSFFIDYQDCQYVPAAQDDLRRGHQPAPDPGRRRCRRRPTSSAAWR